MEILPTNVVQDDVLSLGFEIALFNPTNHI